MGSQMTLPCSGNVGSTIVALSTFHAANHTQPYSTLAISMSHTTPLPESSGRTIIPVMTTRQGLLETCSEKLARPAPREE